MSTIVITGATSGVGQALARQVAPHYDTVVGIGLNKYMPGPMPDNFEVIECDLRSWYGILHVSNRLRERHGPISALVNCAGINRIDYLENFETYDWDDVMDINARSIFYTAKAWLGDLVETQGVICNVVSNASHMPMTASLAYNASKGAAHIMTLQMARELTKQYGITVFGVSPAKVANTGMSAYIDDRVQEVRGWSYEEARAYQLNGLVTGEEVEPENLAEFMAWLLSESRRHKHLSGCILPYGA